MYTSPCKDHDNCPLDIVKLKLAIKEAESSKGLSACMQRVATASEKLRAIETARKGIIGAIKAVLGSTEFQAEVTAAQDEYRQALAAENAWHSSHSSKRRTTLYTIRAHHRGRVHRLRTRQPDGSILKGDLGLQAEFLANDTYAKRVTEEFARPVNSPSKS